MIAVAGYLTWLDTSPDTSGDDFVLGSHDEVGALIPDPSVWAALFEENNGYSGLIGSAWNNSHEPSIAVSLDDTSEAGEAVFVNNNRDTSFFVQARLNREQARAAEREILSEIINNANVPGEQRARAAENMMNIQDRINRESAAESLIESKGFSEVYVRISDSGVDVVVNKETLSHAELAQIMDIIKQKTGVNETQIRISPMRR
jgi:stage III sporulation protein AH